MIPLLKEEIILNIKGEDLRFLKSKAIYWENESCLIISDFHNGKSAHFRKNGISISNAVSKNDLARLNSLLVQFNPKRLLILGDLTHSSLNNEWNDWVDFRKKNSEISFDLVPGNHDILSDSEYEKAGLNVLNESEVIGPFLFSHDQSEQDSERVNLFGHLHPAIRMRGEGRQTLKSPCFLIKEKSITLPAFSEFTGGLSVKAKKSDKIIACTRKGLVLFEYKRD